jgi:hypothetical protein
MVSYVGLSLLRNKDGHYAWSDPRGVKGREKEKGEGI